MMVGGWVAVQAKKQTTGRIQGEVIPDFRRCVRYRLVGELEASSPGHSQVAG